MPRVADPAKQLEDTIARLQEKRRSLTVELTRIDDLFAKYGLQPQLRRRPGRPPGRSKAPAAQAAEPQVGRRGRRRKRGKFSKNAHNSILDFLAGRGSKGATTGEVNKHWKAEGRAGNAYVTLGQLAKQKKVRRENIKGKRGSRYTLP